MSVCVCVKGEGGTTGRRVYRYLLREAKDLEVGVGSASCGDESLKVDESQAALRITSESGKDEVR